MNSTPSTRTIPTLAQLAFILAIFGYSHAEGDNIPELKSPEVFLGMSKDMFLHKFPHTTGEFGNKNSGQYWIPRGQNELLLVTFHADKIALLSLATSSLSDTDQQVQTAQLLDTLQKKYGKPRLTEVGKIVKDGITKIKAAIFDVRPNVSLIAQSSTIELSLTLADLSAIDISHILFSYDQLAARLGRSSATKSGQMPVVSITDFLPEALEARFDNQVVTPTRSPGQVQAKLPNATDVIQGQGASSVKQAGSMSWSMLTVLFAAGFGLLWLVLKSQR